VLLSAATVPIWFWLCTRLFGAV